MVSIATLPALALLLGAVCGIGWEVGSVSTAWLIAPVVLSWMTWCVNRWQPFAVPMLTCGFFCAAATLAADARHRSLDTPLRELLNQQVGGFDLAAPGAAARHDPVAIRAVLIEDGAQQNDFTSLPVSVSAARTGGQWRPTDGGVTLNVGGVVSPEQIVEWRAGRAIETFATFRRPSRYLNDGVPDFETQLALDGTTLFGSIKSGLLVRVTSKGSFTQELAGRLRLHVRRSVERWVAPHGRLSAAIATAVLIGDRTGLPEDVRVRLQAAGTYHVIAISGGNIAILAGLVAGLLLLCGITGRTAALVTAIVLLAYAQVVTAGASVWRATLMAVLYFGARLVDHRSPPWNAIAVTAALVICVRPLDVRDVGFILTFGATSALLEAARRTASATSRHQVLRWLIASLAASVAVEVVLLPVTAWTFSRVTSAGLLLNLIAVPAMGLVQVCGLGVSILSGVDSLARPIGWLGHLAAVALIESARLVEVAPSLTTRVPPPPALLVIAYYIGLGGALCTPRLPRIGCCVLLAASAAAIVTGQPTGWLRSARALPPLRVTAFDVGQGDATLIQFRGEAAMLVDAGGIPFGSGSFDVGSRVLSPALWARGLRRLDALLLTHGDPDHIGGAPAVVDDFAPSTLVEGIPVASHAALRAVLQQARQNGAVHERWLSGNRLTIGGADIRVLHPLVPDWERRRVRNDDSVVLEVRYGDAAVLLLGDVGAAVERAILPQLTPARIRILKVAHHGSRTSTSLELVEQWRPQIAVISCGRGNTFGHPAPETLRRLEAIGAAIYRTDVDGQVTIDTDGQHVQVRTYAGERR